MLDGLCGCGCGERTNISKETRPNRGLVKGMPLRFINGHSARLQFAGPRYIVEDRGYETPCWIWQMSKVNKEGHGWIKVDGRQDLAHRHFYRTHVGPIPAGFHVHHRCEQPSCVNPDHLEALSPVDHGRLQARLPADAVREIRRAYAAGGVTQKELGDKYGCAPNTVSLIVNFRSRVGVV